jgi:hypothetical protein
VSCVDSAVPDVERQYDRVRELLQRGPYERAQAVEEGREWSLRRGMVYQQRPELYESENRVSDLVSERRYAATPNDVALD